MEFFSFRDPICTWSHGVWLIVSIPAVIYLCMLGRRNPAKLISFSVFGASLVFCYAASAIYHGVRAPKPELAGFDRLDHSGIYIFIAGSYTPIALVLLKGRWRHFLLDTAWAMAAGGCAILVVRGQLSKPVDTSLYLAMGWVSVFGLYELSKVIGHRDLFWLVSGGLLYSVGAVINLLGWPVFYRGVFGAHELFHFFTMAGTLCHFWFMLTVVLPFERGEKAVAALHTPALAQPRRRLFAHRLGFSFVPRDPEVVPRTNRSLRA